MKRRFPPALVLFLIAPIFGELFSGSSPLNEYINPVTFLMLSLLYGCRAIIFRELVIRWEKGWLSIFILGAAYGIYEEGVIVQSFFEPLDEKFIRALTLLTHGRGIEFVSFFWTRNFFAYLDYDQYHASMDQEINRAINQASIRAGENGSLSPLGIFFKNWIVVQSK